MFENRIKTCPSKQPESLLFTSRLLEGQGLLEDGVDEGGLHLQSGHVELEEGVRLRDGADESDDDERARVEDAVPGDAALAVLLVRAVDVTDQQLHSVKE